MREETYHSFCETCKKLIPDEHFDCMSNLFQNFISKIEVKQAVEEIRNRYRCIACDGAKCGHIFLCDAFKNLSKKLGV